MRGRLLSDCWVSRRSVEPSNDFADHFFKSLFPWIIGEVDLGRITATDDQARDLASLEDVLQEISTVRAAAGSANSDRLRIRIVPGLGNVTTMSVMLIKGHSNQLEETTRLAMCPPRISVASPPRTNCDSDHRVAQLSARKVETAAQLTVCRTLSSSCHISETNA